MSEISALGQQLRQLRRQSKLSQHQLAACSGVSRSVIAAIESGSRRGITLDNALRLANALDVSVETLSGSDPWTWNSMNSMLAPRALWAPLGLK